MSEPAFVDPDEFLAALRAQTDQAKMGYRRTRGHDRRLLRLPRPDGATEARGHGLDARLPTVGADWRRHFEVTATAARASVDYALGDKPAKFCG